MERTSAKPTVTFTAIDGTPLGTYAYDDLPEGEKMMADALMDAMSDHATWGGLYDGEDDESTIRIIGPATEEE